MNSNSHSTIKIARWRIIEWYDGFLTGLLWTKNECYLAALVSCSDPHKKNNYVLVSMSQNDANELLAASGDDLIAKFLYRWRSKIFEAENFCWANEEPFVGQKITVTCASPSLELRSQLAQIETFEIDAALERGQQTI